MWNSILTVDEVRTLWTVGEGAFRNWAVDEDAYVSSADLKHWWRIAFDSTDIGKDYVDGSSVDLMDQASNVSAADIQANYPGISLP
jgi:hypothetical protein